MLEAKPGRTAGKNSDCRHDEIESFSGLKKMLAMQGYQVIHAEGRRQAAMGEIQAPCRPTW